MPEPLAVFLDQNIPRPIAAWLRSLRPEWQVYHAAEMSLQDSSDQEIFAWAQARQAVIVTYDEDFADQRTFPVGTHSGIVRLRVRPTTIEETQAALHRLVTIVSTIELTGALVIVDRTRIRVRPRWPR